MQRLTATAAAAVGVLLCAPPAALPSPVRLPDGRQLGQVDFDRHVHALLDRLACNAGGCHGSSQERGRFRLSLFAESAERDYQTLVRTSRGRLLSFNAPDDSLLLRKAAGRVPHEGGVRLLPDSWEYQVLRQWIADGAPRGRTGGAVLRLEVTPAEPLLTAGAATDLSVVAHFADGTREDVTPFADFRLPDDGEKDRVAWVSRRGRVTAGRPGLEVVPVFYRGHAAFARVWVAGPPVEDYPALPEENLIDREVFGTLRKLNIVPAPPVTDGPLLRRLTIDMTGSLPSPEEVRAFVADKRPDRDTRKVEELLVHPRHAALWASHFWELTTTTPEGERVLGPRVSGWNQMAHDWLRWRFRDNVPYDRIVRDILLATGREGKGPKEWLAEAQARAAAAQNGFGTDYAGRATLDLFWHLPYDRAYLPGWSERVAGAFLGVRTDCARCHKHPLAPLTQSDHRAFANVFAQVRVGGSPEVEPLAKQEFDRRKKAAGGNSKELAAANLWREAAREVYVLNGPVKPPLTHPDTGAPLPPRVPGGPEIALEGDARETLWRWMVREDNPYFARAFVNRVWAHYFGRGLVDPVEAFGSSLPSAHPRLLDLLARDFAAHGYDVRRLERTILRSATYRLSAPPNDSNKHDERLFSRRYPRFRPAQVLRDLIFDAVHAVPDHGRGVPKGLRALEVAAVPEVFHAPPLASDPRERGDALAAVFGRKEPMNRCSADWRSNYLALYSTDGELIKKGRRYRALAGSGQPVEAVTDEIFLATLARLPTAAERSMVQKYLASQPGRHDPLADIYWALLNTTEFIRH